MLRCSRWWRATTVVFWLFKHSWKGPQVLDHSYNLRFSDVFCVATLTCHRVSCWLIFAKKVGWGKDVEYLLYGQWAFSHSDRFWCVGRSCKWKMLFLLQLRSSKITTLGDLWVSTSKGNKNFHKHLEILVGIFERLLLELVTTKRQGCAHMEWLKWVLISVPPVFKNFLSKESGRAVE